MDENPNKEKLLRRRLVRIVFSLISFAVLTYVAIALITGNESGLFRVFGLFSGRGSVELADEYYFDVGRNRVFADLEDSFAAAGTLGIQVLDADGNETLRDSFRMTSPAMTAQNGRAAAFDIGGTAVRVFNKTEVITSINTGGAIVSVSINRNGWISVCTQESGVTRGTVSVYNNAGRDVYRVRMATGYVLSAVVSPDNRSVAILNLTDDGSRITFYNLSSENVDRVFNLPGCLILDIRYLADGDVLAISTDSLFIVDSNGKDTELYGFDSKRLGSYTLDGSIIALHLLEYSVGHNGKLLTLDEKGTLLGEIETEREIISMSSYDGYLTILRTDGLIVFNNALEALPISEKSVSASGAAKVLTLRNGNVLAAGDHSAVIFRIEN